jgi:isoleucyl-tRNA synthetase
MSQSGTNVNAAGGGVGGGGVGGGGPAGGGAGGAGGGGKGEKNRYKETLNLPQTAFGMKANLVQAEPASMKRWAGMKLYEGVRDRMKGRERFAFHDGPPYANGSIHLGHLMNKVLKDMVVRSKTGAGFDVPYVPGWDCHGLPIEHKVMTEMQEKGKLAKLSTLEEGQRRMIVRRECKAYAEKFHALHTQQFLRLMTMADYERPYLTMQPEYEGAVLDVLAGLLEKGLVYRALKPVHWSIANETALAEAELEYEDRVDLSVYVDFEAADAGAVYEAFGLMEGGEEEDAEEDTADDTALESRGTTEGANRSKKPRAGVRLEQTPCFMIWTTTPWTLPANVAIAVNAKFEYALVWVDGNVTVLATELVEKVMQSARAEEVVILGRASGEKLVGLRYRHPFVDVARGEGVGAALGEKVFRVVAAEYVTLEDGTGLVHTAPGHGEEDYQTGLREGLPVYCPVKGNGQYDETAPKWLQGMDVWKANEVVAGRLRESGHLFYEHKFTHSYPHDWRSKTPTIFRCTEQWFVAVDGRGGEVPNLRGMALEAIGKDELVAQANLTESMQPIYRQLTALHWRDLTPDQSAQMGDAGKRRVDFVPEWGRNRMRGMLESRPDWCISRQRAWGLPIPAFVFVDGAGREHTLMTVATVKCVTEKVRAKGSDVWFMATPAELLAGYDPAGDPEAPAWMKDGSLTLEARVERLKKGGDILDVWFESGSSWNAVMRQRGLGYPADLYLEGSDQHRGWFQLSLLQALGVTGRAPFKTLLTHGFMVGKDGRKLSKSQGDSVEDLFTKYGVDVLRWWVSSLAYDNDVKVDESYFDAAGESYRKVRNTLRFMLSNLSDFVPSAGGATGGHCVAVKDIPPTSIDAWMLGELDRVSAEVRAAYAAYEFRTAHLKLYDFCNDTLSSVYLAAVKDRLYCDKAGAARRRRTQTVLWDVVDGLCRLLAPILPHTADEAWRSLMGADKPGAANAGACVHLEGFAAASGVRVDEGWAKVMAAREAALKAMETGKKSLGVENPLDMGVVLGDEDGTLGRFDAVDLADLLGVSRVRLEGKGEPRVENLSGEARCERSWKRDGTVKARSDGGMLSDRDAEAVGVG